jgi:hypothetical protein
VAAAPPGEAWAGPGQIRADREAAPPGDITHLVAHHERWGDEQAYLLAQEARVAAIRAITDAGRRYHGDWVARAYGPALATLPPAARRPPPETGPAHRGHRPCHLALLRRELGLSQDQITAAIAIRELLDACVP